MYEDHQKLLKEHDAKRQAENEWAKQKQNLEIFFWHFVLRKPFKCVFVFPKAIMMILKKMSEMDDASALTVPQTAPPTMPPYVPMTTPPPSMMGGDWVDHMGVMAAGTR